jgi:hypothetical protein
MAVFLGSTWSFSDFFHSKSRIELPPATGDIYLWTPLGCELGTQLGVHEPALGMRLALASWKLRCGFLVAAT